MKVLIGLVTALLVFLAGLVDAPAAHASPYPHTITTYCHSKAVKNPISRDTRPRFRFWITTNGKKLKPGRYKFKFHTATGPISVYKNCSTASRLRVTP